MRPFALDISYVNNVKNKMINCTLFIKAHFLEPPIQGVLLQCYGAGNMPSNRSDIMNLLEKAVERGVLIVSVTQCTHGTVSGLYETGNIHRDPPQTVTFDLALL